jgi:hypothetical protein
MSGRNLEDIDSRYEERKIHLFLSIARLARKVVGDLIRESDPFPK